jgi:hypothetical protein
LPLTVQFVIVSEPVLLMPAPRPPEPSGPKTPKPERLLLTTQLFMMSVPALSTPPPGPPSVEPLAPLPAWFSVTTTSVSVSVPALRMPPPGPEGKDPRPSRTVRPEMETAGALTLKMRLAAPSVLRTVSRLEPGPLKTTFEVMLSCSELI